MVYVGVLLLLLALWSFLIGYKLFMDFLWDLFLCSVFGDKINKAFEQILQ